MKKRAKLLTKRVAKIEAALYECQDYSSIKIKDNWVGITVELDLTNRDHNCKIEYEVISTIEDFKILQGSKMTCVLPISKMDKFDVLPEEGMLKYCEGQAKEIFELLYKR